MRVLGLDLSLTATGVAYPTGMTGTLTTSRRGVDRLAWFRTQITEIITKLQPDLVVLEDYAFHGRHAHSHELGEMGGVVRLALHDRDTRWVAVVPSSLKKYATGKGNAGKEEVLAAAIRRLSYQGHSHDEADALWLRTMGHDALGDPLVTVPASHRDALAKITWPALEATS